MTEREASIVDEPAEPNEPVLPYEKATEPAEAGKAVERAAGRTCLLVLGMHRSGTSALARTLSLLGAALPKDMLEANETNLSGHWEPARLIALHDEMLSEAGSRWDDWRAFDPSSMGPDRLQHYHEQIKTLLLEEFADEPLFVLKEPRICRFVGIYKAVLADIGVTPLFVLPNRNPLAVAASLEKRDGMTGSFASFVWLRHVLDAEAATRGGRRCLLSYEQFLADWRSTVSRMGAALEFQWPVPVWEAAAEIEAHVRPDLQHHAASSSSLEADLAVAMWVRDAHAALVRLNSPGPESHAALDELTRIRREFDEAAETFGRATFPEMAVRERRASRVQAHFADRVRHAEALEASLKQKIAALHEEAAERDAQLIACTERIADMERSFTWRATTRIRGFRQAVLGVRARRWLSRLPLLGGILRDQRDARHIPLSSSRSRQAHDAHALSCSSIRWQAIWRHPTDSLKRKEFWAGGYRRLQNSTVRKSRLWVNLAAVLRHPFSSDQRRAWRDIALNGARQAQE